MTNQDYYCFSCGKIYPCNCSAFKPTNQDTTNNLIHEDNTLTKSENLNVSNAKSIDEIAKILHETIEIEVWPEEGDYNLDDQSVKAAAEILANKYVAKSVEDKTITAITSKYFMATDPERLALADDIKALISDQVAKAKVDPKLSAAELALEYIQEHKNSKQSGELVGVTNFIGWLSEKARIATLNGVKNK